MCPKDLALFLKELARDTPAELGKLAKQYTDGHNGEVLDERGTERRIRRNLTLSRNVTSADVRRTCRDNVVFFGEVRQRINVPLLKSTKRVSFVRKGTTYYETVYESKRYFHDHGRGFFNRKDRKKL